MRPTSAFRQWLHDFSALAEHLGADMGEACDNLRDLTLDDKRPPAYVLKALDKGGAAGIVACHESLARLLWARSFSPRAFMREMQGYYPDTALPMLGEGEGTELRPNPEIPKQSLFAVVLKSGTRALIYGLAQAERYAKKHNALTINPTGYERPLIDMGSVMAKWDARRKAAIAR